MVGRMQPKVNNSIVNCCHICDHLGCRKIRKHMLLGSFLHTLCEYKINLSDAITKPGTSEPLVEKYHELLNHSILDLYERLYFEKFACDC